MGKETRSEKKKEIKQVIVKKLFGTFDHTIPLYEDGTTILVGPSGIGKTVILKLLNELFSKSNKILQTIPFDEFRVDFEDNTSLWVTFEIENDHNFTTSRNLTNNGTNRATPRNGLALSAHPILSYPLPLL
jgi:predicted ATP-binding protein involved in virulence